MLAKELKERRSKLRLTQVELAEKLGVTSTTVARWEQDKAAIPSFLSLALEALELKTEKGSGEVKINSGGSVV